MTRSAGPRDQGTESRDRSLGRCRRALSAAVRASNPTVGSRARSVTSASADAPSKRPRGLPGWSSRAQRCDQARAGWHDRELESGRGAARTANPAAARDWTADDDPQPGQDSGAACTARAVLARETVRLETDRVQHDCSGVLVDVTVSPICDSAEAVIGVAYVVWCLVFALTFTSSLDAVIA